MGGEVPESPASPLLVSCACKQRKALSESQIPADYTDFFLHLILVIQEERSGLRAK
jgi:hypothetical protein